MLKRIYDKSKILFAVMWIIAYCVLMSAADALSAAVGMEKSVTLAIGLGLSVVLFVFLKKHALLAEYGFCRSGVPARSMLYYIPVCLMLSANLWYGVTCHYGITETVLYILSMFCVGFLEEVIFRACPEDFLCRALHRRRGDFFTFFEETVFALPYADGVLIFTAQGGVERAVFSMREGLIYDVAVEDLPADFVFEN